MCVLILWNLKVQYDPIWLYILSSWVQKYVWLQFNIFVVLMEYMQMLRGGVKCTPPACTCQPGTVLSVHVNSTWWTRYISAPYRALEQCSEKVQLQSTAVWLLGDWGYREGEYIEFNNDDDDDDDVDDDDDDADTHVIFIVCIERIGNHIFF